MKRILLLKDPELRHNPATAEGGLPLTFNGENRYNSCLCDAYLFLLLMSPSHRHDLCNDSRSDVNGGGSLAEFSCCRR